MYELASSSLNVFNFPDPATPTKSTSPNSPYTIFDRQAKLKQRDRAAIRKPVDKHGKEGDEKSRGEASRQTDYVRNLAAENLAERLLVSRVLHRNDYSLW